MSLNGIFPIDQWDFQSRSILMELSDADQARLMMHAREERYQKGDVIFREGAVATGIYFIQSGMVKKYKIGNEGQEHIFYVAGAGEFIGYHAVLADECYPDAAAALEESVLSYIPAADFLEVITTSSNLSKMLLKVLSHEFTVFTNNVSAFAQRPVKERIAIALIILREKFKRSVADGQPVLIKVSRDDIANMAGTTRENVARTLTEFRQEGILSTHGRKIEVTDIRRLADISNFPD